MPYSIAKASQILVENLSLLETSIGNNGVLDLACGTGRNGLFLLQNNLAVTFVDNNREALDQIEKSIRNLRNDTSPMANYKIWELDLEQKGLNPLQHERFDAVLVINYLHRPLLPSIKQVINQAGLIIYETFTIQQARYGRPSNPNYLLEENELLDEFKDWHVIDYFEGIKLDPERAVASIIARKQM